MSKAKGQSVKVTPCEPLTNQTRENMTFPKIRQNNFNCWTSNDCSKSSLPLRQQS